MCLATPMKVLEIKGDMARVGAGGVEMSCALDLLDDVAVSDYVIVHAGYAIQRLSEEDALETLAILERLSGSWEE